MTGKLSGPGRVREAHNLDERVWMIDRFAIAVPGSQIKLTYCTLVGTLSKLVQ